MKIILSLLKFEIQTLPLSKAEIQSNIKRRDNLLKWYLKK